MIKYVIYEAMMYEDGSTDGYLMTARNLVKLYGLKRGKYQVVKFNKPEDIPLNTDKTAYIHLYPQAEEENYLKIKNEIINAK